MHDNEAVRLQNRKKEQLVSIMRHVAQLDAFKVGNLPRNFLVFQPPLTRNRMLMAFVRVAQDAPQKLRLTLSSIIHVSLVASVAAVVVVAIVEIVVVVVVFVQLAAVRSRLLSGGTRYGVAASLRDVVSPGTQCNC